VCSWAAVPALGKQWRIEAGLNADHQLVKSGPYGIVRHPIYASMLAMFLAAGLILTWWPVLLLAFVIFIVGIEIRVRTEDGLLRSRFHQEFEAWRKSVPAYIPFVR
ncbi:MAG: isoprenylcysteine carboxylmethyltransferase family protein, partial [Acidobacteriota bacterium]|nr:isoprenylcysteine carboxylmethyltransferase family protein [Acidobacteriota bacterium]